MHSTNRKAGTAMVGPRVAIPVGSLAGKLGGLCGVGGGIVITPFLKHFTSLTTQRITGTAMLAVTMSALGGGTTYACAGTADLPAAAMLAATASCTTGFGVAVSRRMSSRTLSRAFGGFLLGLIPISIVTALVFYLMKGYLIFTPDTDPEGRRWLFPLSTRLHYSDVNIDPDNLIQIGQ